MSADSTVVFAGADTHADTIHVAVVNPAGVPVADREFPTTPGGYAAAVEFWTGHGAVGAVGVEGTSSYGTGLARVATAAGLVVIEVNAPDRAERRRRGKSDPLDAYAAARAVATGRASTPVKGEQIAGIRALLVARRSAVKAATATINQIRQLLITAPDPVRATYRDLDKDTLITALARTRPTGTDPVTSAVMTALRTLARRHQALTKDARDLETAMDSLVTTANPALRAAYGVGPITAAQLLVTAGGNSERLRTEASFAALCGAAPVPASSGKTTRYRLSRGGDRQANNALHRIALRRVQDQPATNAYAERQRQAGKTDKDILRKLKRAIAREVFHCLTGQVTLPDITDLRPRRQARNITLTAVANHFGVWPATISRIERGLTRNDDLATAYREWLLTA
jgi:transposase